MKLNKKKTKAMIFNFSKDHKFTTDLKIDDETLEIVNQAKLLGRGGKSAATWQPSSQKVFEESGSGRKVLNPSSALSPDQTIQW